MANVLKGLKPEKVFYYFEELSSIPRGSGNEKEVSDYLYSLAKSKAWDVIQDDFLNIIIKKPATKGYENAPVVMLQGHMDMVCEKNEGVDHDFERDPIKLRVVDGWIYATETTLGADNGIAVAMSLAILDSDDIQHPALEVLITSDEEKGMTGVQQVDGGLFKSKYLLNLDSEDEGVFTAGCAGGCEAIFKVDVKTRQNKEEMSYIMTVKGLQGGHSGVDVNKERGNANKILGRILYDIIEETDLVKVSGGSKMNAIPRESKAIIITDKIETVKEKIQKWNEILKNEYAFTDADVNISLKETGIKEKPMTKEAYKKIVSLINLIPSGIFSRSTAIDLVISSNNLGVINTQEDHVELSNCARSSVVTLLTDEFVPAMEQLACAVGVDCKCGDFYPGWAYAKESAIRDICLKTYKEIYKKDAKVEAIHAGLECGLLMEKIKGLDAISMGPDMRAVHSPDEHLSIKSVENVYSLLCEILKKIK